jgi:hypothetical protein
MSIDVNHPELTQSGPAFGGREEPAAAEHHPHGMPAAAIVAWAREELATLTGYRVDSIAGLERIDSGWQITVVVLELHRIPASTDILATYEVTLDEAGDIVNYHRGDRYLRGQVGDHL